jgi:uncharacterized 2Fe-2S/4Fe-4S cluster protein (DUF4445 family)
MSDFSVTFYPHNRKVAVKKGTTLLEAALSASITINNLCGGDGICGACKMLILKGDVSGDVSPKLTRKEIQSGFVLACRVSVESDLIVEIPETTLAKEKFQRDIDAKRFADFNTELLKEEYTLSPLVNKLYMKLKKPTLADNTADHQRICEEIKKVLKVESMQMGLKIIKILPDILRKNDYCVTATVGLRREIAEVMNIESGNTWEKNYMIIVDIGTTTIVAHLVCVSILETIDAEACFNSQGVFGRDVTGRIMSAEKDGEKKLQLLLIEDINNLIGHLTKNNKVNPKDITAVVCSGNTIMSHFLLGLPTANIRRKPYIPSSVEPPPLRAAEVGIKVNPRGLLYSLPGISGWVGSDITAGILATEIHEKEEISLLMDIGTNGEIIVGNKEWLIACSASTGPALEGASVECGMRAESGAIESVFVKNKKIQYKTIGNEQPKGICGSGIIDLISVLLKEGIIDRSGKIIAKGPNIKINKNGIKQYILVNKAQTQNKSAVIISEIDIDNIITAKAAVFAAMKILLNRLDLNFSDIKHFYIAGGFGNYINIENAISIGLLPKVELDKIEYAGNTSIKGAKIVALYIDAFHKIAEIRRNTTYYDLLGADDYIDEFSKAMFLPHTDIEDFV